MLGEAIIANGSGRLSYSSLSINGIQQDTVLKYTIKQVFTNNSGTNTDIFYCIPKQLHVTTYDYLFIVDRNEIKPKICHQYEAQDVTNVSKIQQYEGNGLNSFFLGSIGPNKTIEIHHKVSFMAMANENGFIYTFPLSNKGIYGPFTYQRPENFEFSIHVKTLSELKEIINSVRGTINVIDPHNVIFATKEFPNDESITIETQIKDKDNNIAIWSDGYIAISTFTYFETKVHSNSEFYFIIDCSGSMSGSCIQNAKLCLNIFMHSLPIGCRFSIIKFGSDYEVALHPCDYTDENVSEAMKQLNNIDAEMGGTDILSPLKYVMELTPKQGFIKQVFLLTDGQDSNTNELCALAQENRTNNRIFSIGIGSGADKDLIINVSQKSGGNYVFVDDDESEKLNEKVIELLNSAISYALMHVCFQGERNRAEMWPSPCPPLFSKNSQNFIIKSDKTDNVVISGIIDNEEVSISIPVSKCDESLGMKQLYSRNLIDDYESMLSHKPDRNLEQKCIELSLTSGVPCKCTSFTGVPCNSDNGQVANRLMSKPPEKPQKFYKYSITPDASTADQKGTPIASKPEAAQKATPSNVIPEEISQKETPSAIPQAKVQKTIPCLYLINHQNVDGSWDEFEGINQVIKSKFGHKVAATVAGILYLRTLYKNNLTEFSLMIKKALSFLMNIDRSVNWNDLTCKFN
ncbi:von Willebrand factor type A domain containing protein [Trichomonas vaginalis G3]|uniref:von Willebrand factor type A domain containing protein n=1 Tax=Trichomonas vaginalis (strain ATCC PRA-98 / G3) TaxID=412133 RepID=A2E1S5_TRIV3|nr:von Willebrand factor A domain-containing protein 5A family [Trichomonas vaginalis G3]EAY13404.1 von Willebrand factor type A domain containing protein [Trichomonas vaginalis G3]KAI5528156.1 von Willebrand factor A domain-containing protein 5A family [Trichomonas vaginalis G3]|eukprot:XP_001325627.1 von Willebrand factor type A domain containing protein [Trichomonas vaginalis G3]